MACLGCDSGNQVEFPSEIAIHFSGRENLDEPHVFVSPTVILYLDCGFSGFSIAEPELGRLGNDCPPPKGEPSGHILSRKIGA
jgi:hypothetical protein